MFAQRLSPQVGYTPLYVPLAPPTSFSKNLVPGLDRREKVSLRKPRLHDVELNIAKVWQEMKDSEPNGSASGSVTQEVWCDRRTGLSPEIDGGVTELMSRSLMPPLSARQIFISDNCPC